MKRALVATWILWAGWLLAAAGPLAAKTHVMGRGADVWAVPAWENVFDEGPFDLPAGGTLESSVDDALRLGWTALHLLDDREAERAFRLVVTLDEDTAWGYVGLAMANDAWPGRAVAFANRAVAKSGRASESEKQLFKSFATMAPLRATARRTAEAVWLRELRQAWAAAPAGPPKADLGALLVRSYLRAEQPGQARLRLQEMLATDPQHPVRSYVLWFTQNSQEAADALAKVPPTPGGHRAAGAMLERLGRPVEAAGWYAAAAAMAGARHPSDMEDWRLVEDMRLAQAMALASAGRAEFPDEVPVTAKVEAWLRLEAWDALAAHPDLPPKAPLRDRLVLAHARSLAGFMQNRLPDAHAELAEVQVLLARARSGQGGVTPQELPALEALETELQVHNLVRRDAFEDARSRFVSIRFIPAARVARLALALDLPGEAMRHAIAAAGDQPYGQPEKQLLQTIARTTQQRLPEDSIITAEPLEWPPIPPPPAVPPAAAPGHMPTWTVRAADGTPQSLAQLQDGQPTVFLFFLGHECRHCMDQLRTFDPYTSRFVRAGARVVAVSIDDPEGVAKTFASLEGDPARRPFAFPVVSDSDRNAFTPWGVIDQFYGDAIHGVFVLDAAGRLRWRHLGVEPYMMVADVIAAVEELAAE